MCVAGVEGNPITSRACPLPSLLAKEDHNECLRARVPTDGTDTAQGTGDRAVPDSASPAAEWTYAQGNPLRSLALPLNQVGSQSLTHPCQGVVTLPHITAASMRHLALMCDAAQPRGLGAAPTLLSPAIAKAFPFSPSWVRRICPKAAHWKISLEDRRAIC